MAARSRNYRKLLVQHLPGDGATVTAAETLPGAVGSGWI